MADKHKIHIGVMFLDTKKYIEFWLWDFQLFADRSLYKFFVKPTLISFAMNRGLFIYMCFSRVYFKWIGLELNVVIKTKSVFR